MAELGKKGPKVVKIPKRILSTYLFSARFRPPRESTESSLFSSNLPLKHPHLLLLVCVVSCIYIGIYIY